MKLIDDLMSKEVKLPEGKSSTTSTVLAIFLGGCGVHRAGNEVKAKAHLTCGFLAAALAGLPAL